ncbi:rRNA maturation RNase YbeY [Orientia tsutsugamushi str. Gilliam]|uniref:Endoribonuclease YbeY n=1 Tax=Orientia tsutsugamushi str. Gilliam TaxID=1359184 RepID=A0A2U3RFL9_ORITS|nr:rRNA maturation RNase YbeY [Orientia tsutsugamushi]SPR12024.1 rRNA maturation RNase YbeY [Orientia tsutsugamushi str. Gilliam]
MKIKAALIRQHSIWRNHKEINLCYVKKIIKTTLYHNIFAKLQSVQQAEVVILLTNDHEMQNLNFTHRKINKPTNVLSFPDQVFDWQNLSTLDIQDNYIYLGDVAFGYNTIAKEAVEQQKTFINHFTHLLIHAILHLLGFDHQHDSEAIIMEELEVNLLAKFSIASPY